MTAILLAVLISAAAVAASIFSGWSQGTTIFAGLAGFFVPQVLIGFVIRRKIKKIQEELQNILLKGQQKANRRVQQFQLKPGGNVKQLQRQIESDQNTVISEALVFTDRMEPFRSWSLLLGRQISTIRMQFLYQLKKFEEVDEILASRGLLKKPLMMEPLVVCMKMARQYKNDQLDLLEKTFKRHIKWMRGKRGTLLYGLMSWVYMKQDEAEKARELLIKGKDVTSDETLIRNWEMLTNNKPKHFSNAGLGDEWYGLYLEKPPAPKQQKVRGNARSGRMF